MKKKSTGKGSPFVPRQDECGMETLSDRRRIPFYRIYDANNTTTWYGSEDPEAHMKGVSLLKKDERRGPVPTWGSVLNGFKMLEGTDGPSNRLQNVWHLAETRWLYLAASHAKDFPESLRDFRTPQTAGSIILAVIENALRTGHTSSFELLGKCISAAHKAAERQTKRQAVADAVQKTANAKNAIPRWQDVLQEYSNTGCASGKGTDARNFKDALRDAGFGWLLAGGKRS